MPHDKTARLALAHLFVEMLRVATRANFGQDGRLGSNLLELAVMVTSRSFALQGQPMYPAKVAGYLEIPSETARRTLNALVRSGHLRRLPDGTYVPAPNHVMMSDATVEKAVKLVKDTAAKL